MGMGVRSRALLAVVLAQMALAHAAEDNPVDEGTKILWAVILAIAVPYQVIGIALYIWFRNAPRCAARVWPLNVVLQLSLLFYVIVAGIHYFVEEISCTLRLWHMYSVAMVGGIIYFVRAFSLYFKFEWANERLQCWKSQQTQEPGEERMSMPAPVQTRVTSASISMDSRVISARDNKFFKWKFLVSTSFIYKTVAVWMFITALFAIYDSIATAGTPIAPVQDNKDCKFKAWLYFYYVWGICIAALLVIVAVKLKKTFDAFGLKYELIVLGIAGLIFAVVLVIAFFLSEKANLGNVRDFLNRFPSVLFCLLSTTMACYVPVWNDRKETRGSFDKTSMMNSGLSKSSNHNFSTREIEEKGSSHFTTSLTHIPVSYDLPDGSLKKLRELGQEPEVKYFLKLLQNDAFLKAFESHLVSEFSVENLLFWREVHNFSETARELLGEFGDSPDRKDVKFAATLERIFTDAKVITSSFIVEESVNQVNLSSRTVGAIKVAVEKIRDAENVEILGVPAIFSAALLDVLRLLFNDSFRRFKATPKYAEITTEIREKEMKLRVISEISAQL